MKRIIYTLCTIFFIMCGLLACGKSNNNDMDREDNEDSDYNYPIEQAVNNEIFTQIIEGEVVPVEVKHGIGGAAGYVQDSYKDRKTIDKYIAAMKKVQIKQVITNPDEMYVIFDGIEDYIFVLDDGTELVIGTYLTTYYNNGDVQYVLENTEKLRSIK